MALRQVALLGCEATTEGFAQIPVDIDLPLDLFACRSGLLDISDRYFAMASLGQPFLDIITTNITLLRQHTSTFNDFAVGSHCGRFTQADYAPGP